MVDSDRARPLPSRRTFWQRGEHWVWATGVALMALIAMVVFILGLIAFKGLGAFWPSALVQVPLQGDTFLLGEITDYNEATTTSPDRFQLKVGNRELVGSDFTWVSTADLAGEKTTPPDAWMVERLEHGNFYGFLEAVEVVNLEAVSGDKKAARLHRALEATRLRMAPIHALDDEIRALNDANQALRTKRLKRLHAEGRLSPVTRDTRSAAEEELLAEIYRKNEIKANMEQALARNRAHFVTADRRKKVIPLTEVVRACQPNRMSLAEKLGYYATRVDELLTENPRESNTEGGLLPSIFGTVSMIFIMSIACFPLGVIAGIYLREYAREGMVVRLVRIGVNNLAGIPSIVYGIFGLGFFIYMVGGTIDEVFYPWKGNAPTFGEGCLLWASLTLGVLTVPVVIVSTEEALGAIPNAVRESSLALGATKFQTLWRVLLPMASPGILTGFILAMARAAGEVAPLMITGVVKLAPSLPVDGAWPYLHLDRKFMHLAFNIYDLSCQSPNVEAARPMVYVTTLLLIGIVLGMSSLAILLRTRMRRRFQFRSM